MAVKRVKPKGKTPPKTKQQHAELPAVRKTLTVAGNKSVAPWMATEAQERFLGAASEAGLSRNIKKLCSEARVSRVTFYRWFNNSEGFRDALAALPRILLAKHLPGCYAALIKQAQTGDLSALRMVFEMVGDVATQKAPGETGEATGDNRTIVQIILADPDARAKLLDQQMVTADGVPLTKIPPKDGNGDPA